MNLFDNLIEDDAIVENYNEIRDKIAKVEKEINETNLNEFPLETKRIDSLKDELEYLKFLLKE